jgi:hypothetical protein
MQTTYGARRFAFAAGASLLAVLGSACGGSSGAATRSGDARIVARASTDAVGVARVTVTVSAGEDGGFTPITSDMERSGTQWEGRILRIPVGAGRRFDAAAYDDQGNTLYAGSSTSAISAGAASVVSILMQGRSSAFQNSAPVIDIAPVSVAEVAREGAVDVSVSAHDPDPADTITYRWSSEEGCGSFTEPSESATRWTAPTSAGTCRLTVTVSDDRGLATSTALDVVVKNPPPVIASLTGSFQRGLAMVGALAVAASDPEGDPLTYDWTSSCAGLTFDRALPHGETKPGFSLPGPSAPCAVTVAVSDGSGGPGPSASFSLPANTPPEPQLSLADGASVGDAAGLAYDGDGAIYRAGSILAPGYDFGSGTVFADGIDLFAGRFDPATGLATWARALGSGGNVAGLAASRGQVGVIGSSYGQVDVDDPRLAALGSPSDFIAGLSAADGSVLWVKSVYLNGGKLYSIAGDPGQTRFAVCGSVVDAAATDLAPDAVSGGGSDIVVAVLDQASDDAHRVVWARQIGGAGYQTCTAVAFDGGGDVLIGGQYRGGPLDLGAGPVSPTPAGTNEFVYVARLGGSTGALVRAAGFGQTAGCRALPRAIAVGGGGALALVGQFQGRIDFGQTTLVATGTSLDAFAVRLNADLSVAAGWPTRLGGPLADDALGAAIDSRGQVYVAGYLSGTTTGAAVLTSAGPTDAYLLRFSLGGEVTFADRFGDGNRQEASALVVARLASGAERDAIWMGGVLAGRVRFPPLPELAAPELEVRNFLVKMR